MTFSTPVFWHHQGPRAHQLPDARSDPKGRNVLRKIRAGYTTISPQRTASPTPSERRNFQPRVEPEPAFELEAEPLVEVERLSAESRPLTPPDYESLEPPTYSDPLPPALPGYTPLPNPGSKNSREDLGEQPLKVQRRRYRDVLRRRLTSTKKRLRGDDSDAEGSENGSMCEGETESGRGVVLYRENDQWIGSTDGMADPLQSKAEALPRQRGFRGWLKRTWQRCMDFSVEHPYLFILAVFVIVVIVLCLII